MASFAKVELSGRADGLGQKVVATSTAGTTIHTATSNNGASNDYDEVWIWATNIHTTSVLLTIEFGGTTAANDHIAVTIPASSGLSLVIPGLILENSLVIKAFAGVANVINLFGFANRMTA